MRTRFWRQRTNIISATLTLIASLLLTGCFGNDEEEEAPDFTDQEPIGKCLACGGNIYEHGMNYLCEKTFLSAIWMSFSYKNASPKKSGKIHLSRPHT